jgi:hypothetical protein
MTREERKSVQRSEAELPTESLAQWRSKGVEAMLTKLGAHEHRCAEEYES